MSYHIFYKHELVAEVEKMHQRCKKSEKGRSENLLHDISFNIIRIVITISIDQIV